MQTKLSQKSGLKNVLKCAVLSSLLVVSAVGASWEQVTQYANSSIGEEGAKQLKSEIDLYCKVAKDFAPYEVLFIVYHGKNIDDVAWEVVMGQQSGENTWEIFSDKYSATIEAKAAGTVEYGCEPTWVEHMATENRVVREF